MGLARRLPDVMSFLNGWHFLDEQVAAATVGCSGAFGFRRAISQRSRPEPRHLAKDVGGDGGRGQGHHTAGAVDVLPSIVMKKALATGPCGKGHQLDGHVWHF